MVMSKNIEDSESVEYCEFVSKRITELRLKKDVSEYQMSLDLGQNRTYIQKISSKRSMPSLYALFKICNYFEITPLEFFDASMEEPEIYTILRKEISQLSPEDVEILLPLIQRLLHNK